MNGDKTVDIVNREALWPHEKLREKMVKLDGSADHTLSFFNWFGFRGVIDATPPNKPAENGADGADEDDEEEDAEGMLEVEIFPVGEEIACLLAEELWPNAMDLYMEAQESDADFDVDEDDDDEDENAPELVSVEDAEPARPRKKQRKG